MRTSDEDDQQGPQGPGVMRCVGLALRAHRRLLGQSQRAYAAARGLSRPLLARAEVDASTMSLGTVHQLLEGTGFELAVVATADPAEEPAWDPTDLVARTRSGSRFPPHRTVRRTPSGPRWWWYHEALGSRGDDDSTPPDWSAEGFGPPLGTTYGPRPRDRRPGERPWPY